MMKRFLLFRSGNHSCSAGSVKYNDTDACWGSVTRKDAYMVFLVSADVFSANRLKLKLNTEQPGLNKWHSGLFAVLVIFFVALITTKEI